MSDQVVEKWRSFLVYYISYNQQNMQANGNVNFSIGSPKGTDKTPIVTESVIDFWKRDIAVKNGTTADCVLICNIMEIDV